MSHQQTLYPDQITAEANYFPHITEPSAIDDDPEAPDGLWGQWDGNGNTVLGMGFPTPSSPPTVGAGLQQFVVLIRRNGATMTAEWALDLMEGNLFRSVLASGTLTDQNPVVVSGTWNASLLADPSGASAVCRLRQTVGGSGVPNSGVEVGAAKWVATLDDVEETSSSSLSTSSLSASSISDSSVSSSSSTSSTSGLQPRPAFEQRQWLDIGPRAVWAS